MMNNKTAIAIALLAAAAARAHVTLEQPQAPAGSSYKAVLRVGHGCAGSPTQAIGVRLPPGFRGAHPMPKPGWTLEIKGSGDDVAEIGWRAATREAWLADAHYDEFVLRGQTPAAPGSLLFKILQQCEQGQAEWSAPLQLLPAMPAGHVH